MDNKSPKATGVTSNFSELEIFCAKVQIFGAFVPGIALNAEPSKWSQKSGFESKITTRGVTSWPKKFDDPYYLRIHMVNCKLFVCCNLQRKHCCCICHSGKCIHCEWKYDEDWILPFLWLILSFVIITTVTIIKMATLLIFKGN